MNIAIIGAGNMGGAIAKGLAKNNEHIVTVANHSNPKLYALKADFPDLRITINNKEAVRSADLVILAVKPYVLPNVLREIAPSLDYKTQALVSLAGGFELDAIEALISRDDESLPALFHVIPDTAAAVGRSMTFIAARRASSALTEAVVGVFEAVGQVAVVEERLMGAATALSSCGIAYAYKYIQACVQAGVQMGFRPSDALRYSVATVDGAMAMLQANGSTPQEEIDKVTTPGGMTIKGINELEHCGFTSAVINAILKPISK